MRNLKIIKFRRKGNLRHHLFDIVVTHKQKRFNGSFVEKIGFFNPYSPKIFWIDCQKLGFWLNNGAILHNNVRKYIANLAYTSLSK